MLKSLIQINKTKTIDTVLIKNLTSQKITNELFKKH